MSKVAFLIEGGCHETGLVEVVLAQGLAKLNNIEVFDPIASFTQQQLCELYKKFHEDERQIVTAFRISVEITDKGHNSFKEYAQEIFDERLKAPYPDEDSMPEWLSKLVPATVDNFLIMVKEKYFHGSEEEYRNHFKTLFDEFIKITNKESQNNTIAYLREHPETKIVVGIIGRLHLPMLNDIGKVIEETDKYSNIELQLKGRIVNLHLFGDEHGSIDNYKAFREKIKQMNLITEFNDTKSSEPESSYLKVSAALDSSLNKSKSNEIPFDPFIEEESEVKELTKNTLSEKISDNEDEQQFYQCNPFFDI